MTVPHPSKRASYARVIFHTPARMADEAAGLLVANGALGCAVAEMSAPRSRPKPVVTLEAYFDAIAPERVAQLRRTMTEAGMLSPALRDGAMKRIVDPGWATIWQRRFGPFRVGDKFLIVPPWNRVREKDRVTIVITPARAFGTGHHPTTTGVLRAIERALKARRIWRALDIGTGSGVLAIALRLMGVTEVLGIDIDPTAIENARENAELSGAGPHLRFSSAPLGSIHGRFDLVVANILSSTHLEIERELARCTASGGCLILGGILAGEADEVLERYRRSFRCIRRGVNRGWATLVLTR